ncbi:MAG: hypothetical protein AMXMBFR76_16370 [Pseudomonadota bacterium]|jgi:uncharacterized protein YaiL (DUF2058 family)
MANLLQEQLLKAGLAKPDQLQKAAKEKRREKRQGAPDQAAEQARRAQEEKAAQDRARNLERQAAQERKAQAAEIRQIIQTHKLDRAKGDTPYQFVDRGKICKIYVEAGQRAQLIEGRLVLVRVGERFEVIPPAAAEKIAQRDAGRLVPREPQAPSTEAPAADDPYADYAVPDDLMW